MTQIQNWKLIPSAVEGIPLESERGAFRLVGKIGQEPNGQDEIYLTKPGILEWSDSEKWLVTYKKSEFNDATDDESEVQTFDSEELAIQYIKAKYKINLAIEKYMEKER